MQETPMTNVERLEKIISENFVMRDGVPMPSLIEISPVDSCNRSCSFCPRSNPESTPNNKVQMKWALVQKLHYELSELNYRGLVSFCGYGEPLLWKHIVPAVELLSEVCQVDIITNGDYLTEKTLGDLIRFGINKVLISVYEKRNLPRIESIVCQFPHEKIDVRKRFENSFIVTNRGGLVAKKNVQDASRFDLSHNLHDHLIHRSPCHYMAYSMIIDWNGDVLMCPMDWYRKIKFGNIAYDSLFGIWKSEEMTKVRMKLFSGRHFHPCNKCNTNGTLHGAQYKEAWCKS